MVRRGRGSLPSPTTGSRDRASFTPGRSSVLPSDTQGGSRMPEWGPSGSVRGALSNERPYRDSRRGEVHYHRAQAVREVAGTLDITLMPLPGYSPDLMPVEALWRWLREDVTYHHCHAS